MPTNSVIHVGPGVFETRGAAPMYVADPVDFLKLHAGFVLQKAQRLVGSGLDVTTLRLVLPLDEVNQTVAIGNFIPPVADHAEVSELTVDCNAPGHVAPYGTFPAPVTCGAVNVGGSFIRITSVRAINFCVQARAECFVLSIHQAGNAAFGLIKDCIVEQPGENNTHETTLIAIIGDAVSAGARSGVVRNNYHDCEFANGVSSEHLALTSLDRNTGHAKRFKVTTKRPHGRVPEQCVKLNDVRTGPNGTGIRDSFYFQPFKIVAVNPPTNEITCESPVNVPTSPDLYVDQAYLGVDFFSRGALSGTGCVTEGNAIHNCTQGFYQDTGSTRDVVIRNNYVSNVTNGLIFDFNPVAGGVETPPRFARTGVNLDSLTHGGTDGKTAFAHSSIKHGLIDGETVQISGARIGNSPAPAGTYNGVFQIAVQTGDEYSFTYLMVNAPTGGNNGNADAPTTTNPIRVGIYSLKQDGTNPKLAILETAQAHQLRKDDAVRVTNASIGTIEPPPGTYNGSYSVESVPSYIKFTYLMKDDPGSNPDPSASNSAIVFEARWQVRRLVFEQNVCDLNRYDANSAHAPQAAIAYGFEQGPPFMFPQAVVRDNLFRVLDSAAAPSSEVGAPYLGLRLDSCENYLIEGNILDIPDDNPVHFRNSHSINAFNNLTASGVPLPLSEDIGNNVFSRKDTLEDKVQDAIAFSML